MRVGLVQSSLARKNNYNFTGSSQSVDVSSLINTDRVVDSFIKMAKIDSGSNEALAETVTPSTDGQKVMAKMLKEELQKIGLSEVEMDEHSIVTATLDSNIGKNSPVVGLLAHVDTSPDAPSININPQIHDYRGGDIKLLEDTVIPAKDLEKYIGQKIITSDGRTLLGADDKAGIAEILEALKVFKENPELKHPKLRIAFTPDEETGMGTAHFDIKKFGADVAYTVDGDLPHVVENESYNAFNPEVIIKGKSAHCGDAKGKMINATSVGVWIKNKLPKNQTPETTSGRQGYFHIDKFSGDVSEVKLNMLVRDHNYKKALKRVDFLGNIFKKAEKKFGCKITWDPKEVYRNMGDKIKEFPEVMDYTMKGVAITGFRPEKKAIRGGTDGSHLSLSGLLTPNLGAGGLNFHSKAEFLPVSSLKKCTENIINILAVWAENSAKVMPKILSRRI